MTTSGWESANKIWEEEGRLDGFHEDHWRRAEEQPTAEEAADVTEANQNASEQFDGDRKSGSIANVPHPRRISPVVGRPLGPELFQHLNRFYDFRIDFSPMLESDFSRLQQIQRFG